MREYEKVVVGLQHNLKKALLADYSISDEHCGNFIRDAIRAAVEAERLRLETAIYRMYDCKYEPDKLTCIYENAIPMDRRAAIRERAK